MDDTYLKKELWLQVYQSYFDGLCKHDKWDGLRNSESKKVADIAVKDFSDTFKDEDD